MTINEMKELVDILSNNQSAWIIQDEVKDTKNKLTNKKQNNFYWNYEVYLNRLLNLYYLLTTDYQREEEKETFYLPKGLRFEGIANNWLINSNKRMDTSSLKKVSKIKTKRNLKDVNKYFRTYPNINVIEAEGLTIEKINFNILDDNSIFGIELTDEIKSKLGIRAFTSGHRTICKVTVNEAWKGEYSVSYDVWQVIFEEGLKEIPENFLKNSNDLILLSLPSTLKAIGCRSFYESKIKSLTIPEGVEAIYEEAFSRAYLEEIKLPSTLRTIFHEGFSKNLFLSKIELPEGIKELQDFVFASSSKLKYINLPDSIEKIGIGLLLETAIEEIVLPSKIRKIPERMFSKCSKLSSVKMSDEIASIDREAFLSCEKLKFIELPKELKKVDTEAFAYSGIEKINIPEKVKEIGYGAFLSCKNLSKVNFLGAVKTIDARAFESCSKLQEISLPEGLQSIGGSAFSKCKSIEIIELPKGLKEIKDYCFNECSSLREIRIPESIESIGKDVFVKTRIQKIVLRGININPDIFSQIFCSIQESALYAFREVVVIIPADKNNEKITITVSGSLENRNPDEILAEVQMKYLEINKKKQKQIAEIDE